MFLAFILLVFQFQNPLPLPYRKIPLIERNMVRIDRDSIDNEQHTILRTEEFFITELNTHFSFLKWEEPIITFKVKKNKEHYYLISFTATQKITTIMHLVSTPKINAQFLMLGMINCVTRLGNTEIYPDLPQANCPNDPNALVLTPW